MLGTLGYPVYSLAMFYRRRALGIAAGVFLGLSAGLLWTAQGQLMMSYPHRSQSGRFVSIFWGIFNSGGVLGCIMSFLINFSHTAEGADAISGAALSGGTYYTFFAIMCCGIALSTTLLPLHRVTRMSASGSVEYVTAVSAACPAEAKKAEPTNLDLVRQELRRTARSFSHPTMMLLVPLFFYSNFFYEYHYGLIGVLFNGRTGSLTAACYWMAQILGSFILQAFLDRGAWSPRRRMLFSFGGIFLYIAASWTFGGVIQYTYGVSTAKQALDLSSNLRSPVPAMLAIFAWGFVDSFVQVWSYWVMSQLSDEPEELACFTAFYKFWQNAGAFASFLLGVFAKSFVVDFWANIGLLLVLVAPTFWAIRSSAGAGGTPGGASSVNPSTPPASGGNTCNPEACAP